MYIEYAASKLIDGDTSTMTHRSERGETTANPNYGAATISRLLKTIGFFCRT